MQEGAIIPIEDDNIHSVRKPPVAVATLPHIPVATISPPVFPSGSLSTSSEPVLLAELNPPSTPNATNKRKRVKESAVKLINLEWFKKELSPTSFNLLYHYIGNESELLAEVQKRFKTILSLGNQYEEDGIFDFEGIPQDLRTQMRAYLGSSIRRQAENYHGFAMACQIQKRVEENKGASEAEKKKRYKEIFSVIAGKAWTRYTNVLSKNIGM
ncbi:uncharacterized protein ATC70_011870 [Mucor velutinosus]|uniref:Uncharacterized protein n=1 Tax=Mucor velutinosus TaxID=708070 RepID=A0AAN7D9F0_9FUNG|nr:hypothetical protein ATC70_011870 [Mucor velutinosus]